MKPEDLQAVADGKRTIDSTEAPQVARELLAMRKLHDVATRYSQAVAGRNELYAAIDECDAAREGE